MARPQFDLDAARAGRKGQKPRDPLLADRASRFGGENTHDGLGGNGVDEQDLAIDYRVGLGGPSSTKFYYGWSRYDGEYATVSSDDEGAV